MNGTRVKTSGLEFLAGGGEMGQRLRDLDWASTPLGPVASWPHNLRSTLSLLLTSSAPIALFWGPELVALYNDASRVLFGAEHPLALGRPASQAWSALEESPLRALLESVVRSGEASCARDLRFLIERHGLVEAAYFDITCDPVLGEDGLVHGVLCVGTAATERVVAERRLALLSELAADNGSARTERELCEATVRALAGNPDVSFALVYLDDELQAATEHAELAQRNANPELLKSLPLTASSGARAGRVIVGLDPRRPFDESYRRFLDLIASQLSSALSNARDRANTASELELGRAREQAEHAAAAQVEMEAERVRLLQENAVVTETLNNVGALVASDLDRSKVVQAVTDAATELTGAGFGAFFYNVIDERGEAYTLYTISGVPREAFSKFPMPRNTQVFEPTFKGTGVVRSDDITQDERYGHNAPHHGMPAGHLPVRSYLAVPVKGRGGEVIGGLFFGHSEVARFAPHHERIVVGIAAWAALALDNAQLYESVQVASRLKDEFLASLSHELRTPLNAILGYVRMLQSGMLAPDKRQKAIDTIARNAISLTQIVEDVLDISRIVSGKIRLNVQTVDLPTIVRNAIDGIAPTADARGVRLEVVLDPRAGPIAGDPERLQQVLWNLLSNAVKFTKRDGKVQVRLERVNSHVELTVSDTGIGISSEFLPHVFERFRQAEGGITREHGGLGLGLSISRQLTEMHGGTIEVSSAGLGHGASFCVKLPLLSVQPSHEQGARVHPRSASAAPRIDPVTLQGVHVLAVDDEPDALALIGTVLEAVGARVTTAQSAEEALAKLLPDRPDVLVTDLGMPRTDGFALIAQLRQHADPKIRALPAAALTAYARSEDRTKVLRAGFQIHLAKPIDPAELVTTIASLARRIAVSN